MKRLLVVLLAVLLAASLAACGKSAEDIVSEAAGAVSGAVDDVAGAVASLLSGDVTGEIGKSYRTQWFTFSVESIQAVEEYKGEVPDEGNMFLDIVVTEKNTWEANDDIPMFCTDFYIEADGYDTYEDIYWLEPWDDSMMPLEFTLAPDEEVTYHLIYELPKEATNIRMIYVEEDENNNIGATFTIKHTL